MAHRDAITREHPRHQQGPFEEQFGQTITDFVPGRSYRLSWFVGNFGEITGPGYAGPNSIFAALDGVKVGSGATLSSGLDWFLQSITFTAGAASQVLSFGLNDSENAYMSIDGVSLSATAVPVPAAGLPLVSGLAGLGVARRRRTG